ncbi:hypothetical protein MNBD_ALPHA12-952 [hydrothermal vent metagenome]|uniref:Lon N-terminal domain-containing protein n=1 Tax=hydrothermal vent metagenome TaxID=652676 RepID=A0A3B0U191_9ZZZZ
MSIRPKNIEEIERIVPLFPLSGTLLLPHTQRPLMVFEARYVSLIDYILTTNRMLGLVQPVGEGEESPPGRQVPLQQVGCMGYLCGFEEISEDRYMIVLEGVARFELVEEIHGDASFRRARISLERFGDDFNLTKGEGDVDREQFLAVLKAYAEFADFELNWPEIDNIKTPELVNMCSMLSPLDPTQKQALLEAGTLYERAQILMALAELEMERAATGSILQ